MIKSFVLMLGIFELIFLASLMWRSIYFGLKMGNSIKREVSVKMGPRIPLFVRNEDFTDVAGIEHKRAFGRTLVAILVVLPLAAITILLYRIL